MSQAVNQKLRQVILATFAADSFSLGAHWEYDAVNIVAKYKRLVDLQAPIASYHAGKKAGDLTHIGYNALMLLDVLSEQSNSPSNFLSVNLSETLQAYISKWRTAWDVADADLPGYKDGATKQTLAGLKEGRSGIEAASDDDDMSHTLRWFPLIAIINDEETLVQGAKTIVSSFQKSANQSLTAEFFARTFYRVFYLHQTPMDAVNSAATHMDSPWLNERIAHGQKLSDEYAHDSLTALQSLGPIKEFGTKKVYTGLACGTEFGLPAVIYHLQEAGKFKSKQPSEQIIDTVNAGGNSNARAIAIALILYSEHGVEADQVAQGWINHLNAKKQVEDDLNKILQ